MIRVIKDGNEISFISFVRRQGKRPHKTNPRFLSNNLDESFICQLCEEHIDNKYKTKIHVEYFNGTCCPDCARILRERIKKAKTRDKRVLKHNEYYKKYISPLESAYFSEIKKSQIFGICVICGNILIFPEYHHLLGRKESDFTVSMCIECHLSVRGEQHYISIGRRIEWGYLTTINHTEDTNE